jgi:putative ABC transport system ATP-binding protein
MAEALVKIRNVSKSYYRDSQEIPVLRNINFDIPQGEFLALMGPSGSGKTTLLNLLSGIDRPSSGELAVAGENIAQLTDGQLAKWRSEHIGLVFQFYNLCRS